MILLFLTKDRTEEGRKGKMNGGTRERKIRKNKKGYIFCSI
jgi:hypothetical protein